MDETGLELLIERLALGDDKAAEDVFVEYEPYLRMVVRRMLPNHLRSRFDSVDVVQSIWGDLLQGFRKAGWRFATPNHLKAFLIKATRNRFLSRQGKALRSGLSNLSLDSEEISDELKGKSPEPSEQAQANDLWDQILKLAPAEHKKLIELKRDGYSLQEISNESGYHSSSIRRIFYELVKRAGQQGLFQDSSE